MVSDAYAQALLPPENTSSLLPSHLLAFPSPIGLVSLCQQKTGCKPPSISLDEFNPKPRALPPLFRRMVISNLLNDAALGK
jgi:hypothetical protein